jgi:hypothetical protein
MTSALSVKVTSLRKSGGEISMCVPQFVFRHCEERSDAAIQDCPCLALWIASLRSQ